MILLKLKYFTVSKITKENFLQKIKLAVIKHHNVPTTKYVFQFFTKQSANPSPTRRWSSSTWD